MKQMLCILAVLLCLQVRTAAAEIPKELSDALPDTAEDLFSAEDFSGANGFSSGIGKILDSVRKQFGTVLRQRVRGAAMVLLVVILCGAVDCFYQGVGREKSAVFLAMAGALSVTLAAAGSLETLIGLGANTMEELCLFSKVLLPTLAAATAASGSLTTATFQQVTTTVLVDLLLKLINGVLLPMVYLYIGVLTASCCLPGNRLGALAEGMKKVVTWILTTVLLLFTIYLSVARVISGTADAAAVKITKATISGVVPIVGGIIAEASETVLAGAGLLKNTIGVAGMLSIFAVCAYPFLQLGVQYLLYKITAFLASVIGAPELCRLIQGLGGAFGLVLGMTGSCALLLLISALTCLGAVIA